MKARINKFAGVVKESKAEPIQPAEASPVVEPTPTAAKPEREKGRSHPDNKGRFVSTTVYLDRSVHKPVRAALLEDDRDLSELVEMLLAEWLERRKI